MPSLESEFSFRQRYITWDMLFPRKASVDPKVIMDIMEWPAPKNVDEVRSFMGLASYYRRFIRNVSCIKYSITSLQRKGKKFEWAEDCVASFNYLN